MILQQNKHWGVSMAAQGGPEIGELCSITSSSGEAVLYTGEPAFLCCIRWGFELVHLPTGTLVEVLDVQPNDASIVTVRIVRTELKGLENRIGTVRASWLMRDVDEEARIGKMVD